MIKPALAALLLALFAHPLGTVQAQNTLVTYQGRVTSNGTGFTGSGQFEFALVTSTNSNHPATATANTPSGGYITGYVVVGGGNGYVTAPVVTVSGGGGSGAAAVAHLTGGVVTSISVGNPGNGGYASAPTVTIAPPPASIAYTTFWSNDGTSSAGSQPAAAVSVAVTNGLFTVGLGDTTLPGMTALAASLFMQPNLQLRIWFNDGVNGFAALSPVQNLTTAPYAAYAYSATTLTTASNQPVNLTINGMPVLRIAAVPDLYLPGNFIINSIGGASANIISNGVVGGFIGGGGEFFSPNRVGGNYAAILGGVGNTASGYCATVIGNNATANNAFATAMGYSTTASGQYSTAMGFNTTASGSYSTAMGNTDTAIGNNSTAMGYATYAGSNNAVATGEYSMATGYDSTAMGFSTTAQGTYSTAMGRITTASGDTSTAMGVNTTASGQFSTAMGQGSIASGLDSVAAGLNNIASGINSVAMGETCAATNLAAVALGYHTTAGGSGATALGVSSQALHNNTFVWSDGSRATPFASTAANQFAVCASGGMLFLSSGTGTSGVQLSAGGGSWSSLSDRNAKTNFGMVDGLAVLEKLVHLPVKTWNYKTQADAIRHIGPMAQDFAAAFGVGEDNTHITTVDEGGVALAAIQGLNQKLENAVQARDARIAALERELAGIKELITKLSETKNKP